MHARDFSPLNTLQQQQNRESCDSIQDIGCVFKRSGDPHASYVKQFKWLIKAKMHL